MLNIEIENEILDNFIPQEYYKTGNTAFFKWKKGNGYVQVVVPSHKHGDNESGDTYITTATGQTKYTRTTNVNIYNLGTLRCMLNVLNKS